MSQFPFLPLKAAKQIEPLRSWEDIKNPTDLVNYLVRNLSVDPNSLLKFQEIISSSLEPSGNDKGKLWVKTDGYPAIGIYIGSSYKLIAEYPFDVPLLWTKPVSEFPSYLTKLTEEQMTQYGLSLPEGSTHFYFILTK